MNTMNRFQQEIADIAHRMTRMGEEIRNNQMADKLLNGIDLSDVSYTSLSLYSDVFRITITLDGDKMESKLPHKIAQRFHLKFTKAPSWDKESLTYKATSPATDDQCEIHWCIEGCKPKTCQLIMREIPLTEEEIEAARVEALSRVKTVRIEREIKCK